MLTARALNLAGGFRNKAAATLLLSLLNKFASGLSRVAIARSFRGSSQEAWPESEASRDTLGGICIPLRRNMAEMSLNTRPFPIMAHKSL